LIDFMIFVPRNLGSSFWTAPKEVDSISFGILCRMDHFTSRRAGSE
jgi:hypothetical protein